MVIISVDYFDSNQKWQLSVTVEKGPDNGLVIYNSAEISNNDRTGTNHGSIKILDLENPTIVFPNI